MTARSVETSVLTYQGTPRYTSDESPSFIYGLFSGAPSRPDDRLPRGSVGMRNKEEQVALLYGLPGNTEGNERRGILDVFSYF